MTIDDLIADVRNDLRDNTSTRLWSDSELYVYADEGQREIARRALVLNDSATFLLITGIASYALAPLVNLASVALGTSVISIDQEITVTTGSGDILVVRKRTIPWLNANRHEWRNWVSGKPHFFVEHLGTIMFVPSPSSDFNGSTVTLYLKRMPLNSFASGTPVIEVDPRYYDDLKWWMKYRAYDKKDAETYKPDKSLQAYQKFEASIGIRENANIERIMMEEPEDYMQIYLTRQYYGRR